MAHLAQRLAEQDALRPDQLYTGRSLPADRVAATLITTAERGVCR